MVENEKGVQKKGECCVRPGNPSDGCVLLVGPGESTVTILISKTEKGASVTDELVNGSLSEG